MQSDTAAGVLAPQALARTYNTPGQLQPWDAVEQYERVMRAASQAPNKGSAALASKLELPRGRIRPWLDGAKPDVVRAIETARELGWFDDERSVTTAWATLLAGVLGGGSIAAQHYRPQWTTEPADAARHIRHALEALGVGAATVARDGRPDQLQPDSHSSLLGRALVALGAPQGDKNEQSVETVPAWLLEAADGARRSAAEVIVLYRGRGFDDKDTIALFEQRSLQFRESMAALLGSVVDGTVTAGERFVTVSAGAARELGMGRGGPRGAAIRR